MEHPLATYRAKRNLTQVELASELGVSDATIARWENGKRRIEFDRLTEVSKRTGIPPAQLRPDLADILQLST